MHQILETTETVAAKNWIDELVNDPLIFEFERVGMAGIWSAKTRDEISQWILLQREKHYPPTSYDERVIVRWNMLWYHFERFKHTEEANSEAPF